MTPPSAPPPPPAPTPPARAVRAGRTGLAAAPPRSPDEEPPIGDGWYESEEPTRLALTFELRRIALRLRVRPLPVLLLAVVLTTFVSMRFLRKPRIYSADVVLAITEGAQLSDKNGIPFHQLREYVWSVLMPDAKLLKLIEERNLHRLRHTLGPQYALGELRSQIDLQIWKNSFVHYEPEDHGARKSARIGLSVLDTDPDLSLVLARDLASIIIETHEEQRGKLATKLAREVGVLRESLEQRIDAMHAAISLRQTEAAAATQRGEAGLAGALAAEALALSRDAKEAETQLTMIARSPDAMADQFAAAGLGMRIDLVEERRPDRQEQSPLVLVMVVIVVGTGALLGSALFIGAFDSRVHDTDDVARLGLPVLGHVPGFAGDHVGSLHARGARRARVPFWLRWRSPR